MGGWLSGLCRWDKRVILKWWPTNKLTPWSTDLLEKLTGPQLVKKLPTFYGTWRFMTAFERNCHLSIFWAKSIHFMPHIPRRSWMFRKMAVFYGEELLAPCVTLKLEGHPLSAHGCIFDIFIAAFHIGGYSSICNLRMHRAVVRGSHLSWCQPTFVRIMTIYSIWM